MRIVVGATSHPLPVTNGMRLHLAHLLAELRTRHDVTLVTVPHPGDDVSPAALEPLCSSFRPVPATAPSRLRLEIATLVNRRSIVLQDMLTSGLPEAVHAAVRDVQPDVVHLETGATAAIAPALGVPAVVAALDADDLNAEAATRYAGGLLRRFFGAREARRWRRFERTAYGACDAIVVVSARDAAALRGLDPRLHPYVVPNGVDATHYTPAPGSERDPGVVLLTGAMDYPPNVDAALFAATEVLPLLLRRRPDVRLVLAGRDPSERVRALAGEHVEVTGTLPDLRPLLRSAGAYLCPMRLGSGIKNKLLEALACGCPSVATTLGTAGLGATPGRDLLVADDADGLAAALDRILGDPPYAASLGEAGRVRATALSWAATADGYERVYAQAMAARADN